MTNNTIPLRRRFTRGNLPEEVGDPAIAALTELLTSEREVALRSDPDLLDRCDAGRVWLLWFAIGATEEICNLVQRDADHQRNLIFRQIVGVIFNDDDGLSAAANHSVSSRGGARPIDLFLSAGAAAVQACMRGESCLGYYLEALKTGAEQGALAPAI
jgi:hypothetical protein